MENKPIVIILSPRFPFPLEKGDKLRLYHTMRYLSNDFSIHLISLSDESIDDSHRKEIDKYADETYIIEQSTISKIQTGFQALIKRKPFQTSYYYQRSIQKKIDHLIEIINPDLIYVQLVRMARYVQDNSIPKVLDYMDAMSLNMKREATRHSFPMSMIYKREARLLAISEAEFSNKFQIKTIISEPDKLYLIGVGVSDLLVQGNGVDIDYFKNENLDSKEEYDVAFVGNMGYLPNVEAAEFLVKEVISKYLPDAKVLIAGARPHKRVKQLATKNVKVTGWVEDIRHSYINSKILVAPIFTGAGQQNKILEGMSLQKACITTSQVNNAIGGIDEKNILIANTDIEFYKAIEFLLNNHETRRDIGKNARIFVEQKFSWENQINILSNEMKKLLKTK